MISHRFILVSLSKFRTFRSFVTSSSAMKIFTQKTNPITGAAEWDIQSEDYDYHQEIARSAFADMLHDTERNKKYYIALKKAIDKMHNEGKMANVLDIGTGTGLLSIMAAQCGADSIVACEAFKPMAECALKILQQNNVADKIHLIPKRSTDIVVGENGDMKERANILVTEVFDTELIGEGAISTFLHAHRCLLQKDCIVVPESAVIYAQVVECPTMQKWNKVNDLADEDLKIILRTPEKVKSCAGSAAVHDIQLSQLPVQDFRPLSEPLPVYYFDWSGRSVMDKCRKVKQKFISTQSGVAQMVFMWWDLNMDSDGTIISCAPWWCHAEADLKAEHPEDTIPWRDHWMQAVYYFPSPTTLERDSEYTLLSCHDEYSLWFSLQNGGSELDTVRPVCSCGTHMALSRTHVSYLNDGRRSKRYLAHIAHTADQDAVVLCLNAGSLLGLAAAAMGAKKTYYVETKKLLVDMLQQYIAENSLQNVEMVPELTDEVLRRVTLVICDPNLPDAIHPYDNLRLAYQLHSFKGKMSSSVKVLPGRCTLYAVPVQFLDLHKIRAPLQQCESIDMTIFDRLVESSRRISDDRLEAQPLWEYPCVCRGVARQILCVDLNDLRAQYSEAATVSLSDDICSGTSEVNGVVVWSVWEVGSHTVSHGALGEVAPGRRLQWDMHTRQAVYLPEKSRHMSNADTWSYEVRCNLEKGTFHIEINI